MRKLLNYSVSPECPQCLFAGFCLDKDVSIPVVQYTLKKGESLNIANEKFNYLYIVQKGALKAYAIEANGREIIHGLFLKNEIYGYEAIARGYYLFSAAALSDTVLCQVNYESFLELMQSNSHFLSYSLHLMSQQLYAAPYLRYVSAQQKMTAFIVDLRNRLSMDGTSFALPCSYQQIGNYLGLATETISRIFSQFKQEGLITIDCKCIVLLDVEKLENLVKNL